MRVLDISHGLLEGETHPALEFVGLGADELHGGMADESLVRRAVAGTDVIYHLAISWFGWKERPSLADLFDANIRGTLNLLEAAKTEGVKHFLFASSEAVYGRPESLTLDEEASCRPEQWRGDPGAGYGILKLTTEKLCLMYCHQHGLPVTVFRVAVVFSDTEALLLSPRRVGKVLNGETLDLLEGQGRATIHVDDVVGAFLLAAENEDVYGQVLNLSNPETYLSDRELYQLVVNLASSPTRIEMTANSSLTVPMQLSVGKVQRLLGWRPRKGRGDLERAIRLDIESTMGKHGAPEEPR